MRLRFIALCLVVLLGWQATAFAQAAESGVDGGGNSQTGQDAVAAPAGQSADGASDGDKPKNEDSAVLPEVRVSDERPGHDGAAVEAIDSETILERGATTAAEAMATSPSVVLGTNSRNEQKFTLRGFDQRQVLILIDGLPLTAPYSGITDVGRIPAEVLESVQLIKGAASLRYGAQGLGGAVNLETRQAGQGPKLLGFYELRVLNGNRMGAAYSDSKGPVAWLFATGFTQSTGYTMSGNYVETRNEDGGTRENSDSFDWHLIGKLAFSLAPAHTLSAGVMYFEGMSGVPPHVSSSSPRFWRWPMWRDINAYLTHSYKPGARLELDTTVFAVFLDNTLDAYDDDGYSSQETANGFQSTYYDKMVGFRMRGRAGFDPGPFEDIQLRWMAMARYDRHQTVWTDDDDGPVVERLSVQFGPELAITWHPVVETLVAFRSDLDIPLSSEDNNEQTLLWGWGPLAEIRLHPHEIVTIEAVVARQVRFPTLSERYGFSGRLRLPNPDLEPESAINTALDVTLRPHRDVVLRIGGFESEVTGLLEETTVEPGVSIIENVERVRLAGAELEIRVTLPYGIDINAGYVFLKYWRLGDTDVEWLEYRPTHRAQAGIYARPIRWIGVGTNLQITGPQHYMDDDSLRWGELGYWMRWDARFDVYPTAESRLWLRATNLLDMNYSPRHGYPAAGRTFWLGAELRLP